MVVQRLVVILVFSLEEMSAGPSALSSRTGVLIGLCFDVELHELFCIFWRLIPCQLHQLQILVFSPISVDCLFIVFMVSFAVLCHISSFSKNIGNSSL